MERCGTSGPLDLPIVSGDSPDRRGQHPVGNIITLRVADIVGDEALSKPGLYPWPVRLLSQVTR